MSERNFSRWLWVQELKPMMEQGIAWWFKPPTASVRGVPDYIGCVGGYFVSLELKLDGARKDPSRETLQNYTAHTLTRAGCKLALTRVTKSSWEREDRQKVYDLITPRTG